MSASSRDHVRKLLAEGGDKDLVSVASWSDQVILARLDTGPLRGDHEAIDFDHRFPNSGTWHFINLPLGIASWEQASSFSTSDDIVQAVARCIQVLEAPASEQPPGELTKVEALRLLVHLVGDIHQPLHCGTGFYKFSQAQAVQLVIDPQEAKGTTNDRGGNLLFYGPNETDQLHALWDRVLVEEADKTIDYHALADFLMANYLPKDVPLTPGDYHEWAQRWAIESVQVARLAYQGITFKNPTFDASQRLHRIEVELPKDYIPINSQRAAAQIARAGAHLSQLFDKIRWQVEN